MKNKYLFQTFLSIFMVISSAIAYAHPGHDHTHWFSGGIHLIFFGGVTLTLATLALIWTLKIKKSKNKINTKID